MVMRKSLSGIMWRRPGSLPSPPPQVHQAHPRRGWSTSPSGGRRRPATSTVTKVHPENGPQAPTTLLITGGAGFIGSNLARRALEDPRIARVVVLDDFSTGSRENLAGLDVDLVEGSVTDPAALAKAVDGVDAVVHLAALASVPASIEDPLGCHEANATGTLLLLEACRAAGIGQLVGASSS